jgi:shikimate dehydrogenase
MILSGKAKLAGVLGWPVGHSRSPRLHGYWLDRHGIDGAYVPLPVRPEHFETAVRGLIAAGFTGFNVTVPHKEAAFRLARRLDDRARAVGAVNTLMVDHKGVVSGTNTDIYGFTANVRDQAPAFDAAAGQAVVLGAGGAARAVVAGLIMLGADRIVVVNRTRSRAEDLARAFDGRSLGGGRAAVTAVPWPDRDAVLDGAGMVVNTTVLGMAGHAPLDLDLATLPKAAVVADIVYAPLETGLLARARAAGHATVDGLGMLLHQAVPGFEAWFGVRPEVTPDLRAFVLGDGLETGK